MNYSSCSPRPVCLYLQELGQALNTEFKLDAVATTLLANGMQAFQHATSSIQETAVNCQHNLLTLSSILQHGLILSSSGNGAQGMQLSASQRTSGFSPSRPMSSALVPTEAPFGLGLGLAGALVPWTNFPGSPRAKDQDAADSMTVSSRPTGASSA